MKIVWMEAMKTIIAVSKIFYSQYHSYNLILIFFTVSGKIILQATNLLTFIVNENESISEADFMILSNEEKKVRNNSVKAFSAHNNRNIQFLPINLHTKIPDTQFYRTVYCGVKIVLKKNFEKLEQLHEIQLHSNLIETIEENAFSGLNNLLILILKNNRIKELDETLFSNVSSLQLIDVSFNKIFFLPNDLFSNLGMLKTLVFKENSIEILPKNLFDQNSKLDSVNFSSNKIGKIYISYKFFLRINFVNLRSNICINNCYFPLPNPKPKCVSRSHIIKDLKNCT